MTDEKPSPIGRELVAEFVHGIPQRSHAEAGGEEAREVLPLLDTAALAAP